MSEEEVSSGISIQEHEPHVPNFINKLQEDYPELAQRIENQIPEWRAGIDEISEQLVLDPFEPIADYSKCITIEAK